MSQFLDNRVSQTSNKLIAKLEIVAKLFGFLLLIVSDSLLSIFFYRLLPFLCFLLLCYRLVESLYFTSVLVASA